jgi:hypothetical protein
MRSVPQPLPKAYVSFPMPPTSVSLPAPPVRMLAFASPVSVSFPEPPVRFSMLTRLPETPVAAPPSVAVTAVAWEE